VFFAVGQRLDGGGIAFLSPSEKAGNDGLVAHAEALGELLVGQSRAKLVGEKKPAVAVSIVRVDDDAVEVENDCSRQLSYWVIRYLLLGVEERVGCEMGNPNHSITK
jgi:hypothetical protein